MLGAQGAMATTTAGSTVTNNVTVNFNVGGFAQTAANGSAQFVVDRKVNVVVAESGSATTTVSPAQTGAVVTYTVTNQSNAALDFALAVTQVATGSAGAHTNTDSFNVTAFQIYKEADATPGYSAGDTVVTYLDELPKDGGSATIYVVSTIPSGLATGAVAALVLTATSQSGGGTGTQGTTLTQDTGADTTMGMETVFADAAGSTDALRDGKHSAMDDYTVLAANLSATKSSKVISDPVNGTTNPKAIPGATIEYCIKVANAAGSALATNVAVSDVVPAEVTYSSGYGIFVNGTIDGLGACNTDGTSGGSFAAGTVSGTLLDVAASQTRTLRFRATIN
jgi:uncharacterized repeat protein (TIGR01451 family)